MFFFCYGFVFFPLLEEGDVCAPHFFFSRERKRNVPISAPSASLRSVALRNAPAGAGPVQRKRALGAAFVTKAAPFSFVLYVLKTGSLVLCGLVSPFAPLPLTGWENCFFTLKKRLSFRKPLDVFIQFLLLQSACSFLPLL